MACPAITTHWQYTWLGVIDNPFMWWDNRAENGNNYPDVRHASTGESLWMISETFRHCNEMQQQKVKSNISLLLAALKASSSSGDLERGRKIHSDAIESRDDSNIYVASTLVDMYAKCGSMVDAHGVFEGMSHHDAVSWTALILGYAQHGEEELALQLFARMRSESCAPDARVFVAALKACSSLAAKEKGKEFEGKVVKMGSLENGMAIHSQAANSGCESNIFVANTLVDMYATCGSMVDACGVFDRMRHHNVVTWNALMLGYAENGEGELALQLFAHMLHKICAPNARTFVAALKACTSLAAKEEGQQVDGKLVKMRSLEKGMVIHSQAANYGCDSGIFVGNTLIDMYVKCGSMVHARGIFKKMLCHDVVSWTALMAGYAENGEGELALQLFACMQSEGCAPDARTFIAALRACTSLAATEEGEQVDGKLVKVGSLEKGMAIHSQAAKRSCDSDIFVASTLVDMYAKCVSVVDARGVFDRMQHHNVVSWTALMLGYAENGEGELALQLFARMQGECCAPDARIFVAALKACTSLAAKPEGNQVEGKLLKLGSLEKGMAIHSQAANCGCDLDIFVASTLVDMYGKCGSMLNARRVFDRMLHHNLVSWNALILGYAENREGELALQLFSRMQSDGCAPDARVFVAVLKACTSLAAQEEAKQVNGKLVKIRSLEKGIAIHSEAANNGCDSDIFVTNTLVDMYAKCGSLVDARMVFERIPCHDVVSWTTLMLGYAENGEGELALELFARTRTESFAADARNFVAALKVCTSLAAKEGAKQVEGKLVKLESLENGMAIHSQAAKSGCDSDIFVVNILVDMYAKCGSMVDARGLFERTLCHDVVSWTALMLGYAENGEGELALQLFARMQSEGSLPDARIFVAALKACTSLAAKEDGKQVEGKLVKMCSLEKVMAIHSQASKSGCDSEIFVASTLVDIYAKCGSMLNARGVFDRMPNRDVVSWTAMILGYVQSGDGELALQLFARMQDEGCAPNGVTFVAALKACGSLGALETGKTIEVEICNSGLESDAVIAACLVDFYGKCGSMVDAQRVFDSLATRDLVTWNALIAGYSHQGDTRHVFDLFERMQRDCLQADGITFLSILTVCSHAGLVDKGKEYFHTMCSDYLISAGIEHYTCMVDLFGRANHLDDALAMVKNMPFEPDLRIWTTVLGACGKWRNVAVGRLAFESMLRLDNQNAAAYVLMGNIYAGAGMWEENVKIQAMRRIAREEAGAKLLD